MRLQAAQPSLIQANPHLLATIADASERCAIIAARDIIDTRGVKLWARNQAVSRALQERLAARDLATPLEGSLAAVNGVTSAELQAALQAFVASAHPLSALVRPHAAALAPLVGKLPLHPVAQTLLTLAREGQRRIYDHAVRAMALAGAMCTATGGDAASVKLALLGGLLHDLGEMYIEPACLVGEMQLDGQGLVQLAVHPDVGRLLLSKLTDYPPALARAVAEHHERLDGSGYPAGADQTSLSELGRLLAVVETVIGAVETPGPAPLWRARLAVVVLPSEHDQSWTSMLGAAARSESAELEQGQRLSASQMQARLRRLNHDLQAAQTEADELCLDSAHPALRDVARFASRRLAALRVAWADSGLWALDAHYDPSDGGGDVELMERELHHRMQGAWRSCVLRGVSLSNVEQALLEPMRGSLCNQDTQ